MFIRYVVATIASHLKLLGRHTSNSIALALSRIVLLNLLVNPFYWRVPTIVLSLAMPSSSHNFMNSLDKDSNPLFFLSFSTSFSVWFSTRFLQCLNFSNVLSLVFNRWIQSFLKKSSTIDMKYLATPFKCPHKLEWI